MEASLRVRRSTTDSFMQHYDKLSFFPLIDATLKVKIILNVRVTRVVAG